MLLSYLKSAFRNLAKRKLLSAAIIFGLALGILSSFLLLTYVFDQLSYDRYLPDAKLVYRITSDYRGDWGTQQIARCYEDWIDQFKDYCPDVVQLVKFYNPTFASATVNGNKFRPENFYEVDSTFFQAFPFQFLSGNPSEALKDPLSMVITKSVADRYFGNENPIGRRVKILDGYSNQFEYHVTGVVKNIPVDSHFHPEFIAGWKNRPERSGMGYYYILVRPGTNEKQLQNKLDQFVLKHVSKDEASQFLLHLQPLTDIHLMSHLNRELEVNGNLTQVYALLIMAILIMIITCINYVNLSIAKKTGSTKELGVRRVLGANGAGILLQNITEAFIYIFLSLIIVFLLFEPSLSFLARYLNLKIGIDASKNLSLVLIFIGEVLLLGLISGGYPTLALHRLAPANVLSAGGAFEGPKLSGGHGLFSRKVLLVVQFSLAILLIASVVIIVQQMNFVSTINMGYDPEQIVAIPNVPDKVKERYPVLKKELEKESGVVGVTTSLMVPSEEIVDKGKVAVEGKTDFEHAPFCDLLPVDKDFVGVMKMKLVAGSSFDRYIPSDPARPQKFNSLQDLLTYLKTTDRVYLLNEAAVRLLGWKSPDEAIGKQIGLSWAYQLKYGPVVGVVKNFHFTSLHRKIEPTVMFVEPLWYNNILIRVKASDINETLARIRKVWDSVNPEFPFDYEFVSDAFAAKYLTDNQFKVTVGLFSSIAIVIACIGLFAVSMFTTERRIKEIGIRKVLGASVPEIVTMLTRDLTKWIVVSNVVAWPLAYYGMNKWLQGFAYHIDIQIWIFLAAGFIAFSVAALTVGLQAVRAALANPVESLRYE